MTTSHARTFLLLLLVATARTAVSQAALDLTGTTTAPGSTMCRDRGVGSICLGVRSGEPVTIQYVLRNSGSQPLTPKIAFVTSKPGAFPEANAEVVRVSGPDSFTCQVMYGPKCEATAPFAPGASAMFSVDVVASGADNAGVMGQASANDEAVIVRVKHQFHLADRPAPFVAFYIYEDPRNPFTPGRTYFTSVQISAMQTSDTLVLLTSSNPAVAPVPSSLTIPAGEMSKTFQYTILGPGTAVITASLPAPLGGDTHSATITVKGLTGPPAVSQSTPTVRRGSQAAPVPPLATSSRRGRP